MAQNDYIPVRFALVENPKYQELVEALQTLEDGVSEPEVIGHLYLLWRFAAIHGEGGNIGKFKPKRIAQACRWTGDPQAFMDALVKTGFLEHWKYPEDMGLPDDLEVHDWRDYYGRLEKEKKASANDNAVSRENKERVKRGEPRMTPEERAEFLRALEARRNGEAA
jgi:hypothetical protein